MNQIDVYYRALLDYRAQTEAHRQCVRLNKAFSQTDAARDKITVTHQECTIDEDWVRAIEEGLVYIEKAIKEERQFIQSNGEVIPIEKVKHVSKDSVEHLAKHSNLITKEQTGEDIIPDQLYTVERLNDYAVYENRFLYMLLCYLRDFVTLRYNNILDATNKYDGTLKLNKDINAGKQKITYSVYLHDERQDDDYLREHNSAKAIIDRIALILKAILAFLATPLMEYASKVAMLKPPITKTNVLKMDNNFKGAVRLYDYIVSYEGKGYSVETVVKELSPFKDDVAAEISEAGAMLTFLTYEHGLGIEADLKLAYEEEEAARRVLEIKKRQEEIELLKKRALKNGEDLESYALALEKQVKLLLRENEKIEPMAREIDELRETEAMLRETVSGLEERVSSLEEELVRREEEYRQKIEEMEESFAAQIAELKISHMEEIEALNSAHEFEIDSLKTSHEFEIYTINSAHEAEMEKVNKRIDEINEAHRERVASLESDIRGKQTELDKARADYSELDDAKCIVEAKLLSIKAAHGLLTDEDKRTDKERFDELEREHAIYERFYKQQWRETKKSIRKKLLTVENFKKQDDESSKKPEDVDRVPEDNFAEEMDIPVENYALEQESVEDTQAASESDDRVEECASEQPESADNYIEPVENQENSEKIGEGFEESPAEEPEEDCRDIEDDREPEENEGKEQDE